jgi:protocatechuate 3,4-dioxygenase beta subunit
VKTTWSVLAWLSVITALGAQDPVRDTTARSAPVGTAGIAGVIRDETGRSLRRASVVISGDMAMQRGTITDDDGRFAFANLPAGRFTITASKPAYPSASYGARRPNRPGAGVLVSDGQQVTDIAITLARGAVITGTVFDEQGQPIPGVPVMPWEVRASLSGQRTLDMPATGGVATTTDDHGEFRFFGLPPGEYTVGTSWFYSGLAGNVRVPSDAEIQEAFQAASNPTAGARPPAVRPDTAPGYNYAKVFHPNTLDPMTAATVQLHAGEVRNGMDVHMQFRPMSKIEAVVSGPEGTVSGARISIARTSNVSALNSVLVSSVPPTGRYESPSLGPGDYTVTVQTQAAADRPAMWAMRSVTLVDAEPMPVALELQPAMTLTGRVVFDSISQVPPPFPSVRVSFYGVSRSTWATLPAVTVDATGTFTRDGVLPAGFRVGASVADGSSSRWTLKSVTMGGQDVTDLPVELRPGESAPLIVTMTDRMSEVSGTLIDPAGQPSTDYFVVAIAADRAYWTPLSRRIVSSRPDARGRFLFRALPAGEYRLAATTDLVSADLQEVRELEALLTQSIPFELGLGEKKTIDIRVAGR